MLKILAKETGSMDRALIYECRGTVDVFRFPLEESFENAEIQLNRLISARRGSKVVTRSEHEHVDPPRRKKKETDTRETSLSPTGAAKDGSEDVELNHE